MNLALYRAATALLEPLAPAMLKRRARRGKEDPARTGERLGRASRNRPDGALVWLHGVSVGESVSLLPLIERLALERPTNSLLVTTGTVTAARIMAERLPKGAIHQYAPVDGPRAVSRFLDHWAPNAGLFAESELWPNLILEAKGRGVRLGLVSARITEASAKGWAKRPGAARRLIGAFDLILPQDEASKERLFALGADPGPKFNLKLAAPPLPADASELGRLRGMIGERRVITAASTHPGEETLVARAAPPGALTIVAVRHPERGAAVAEELRALGLGVARRGAGEPIGPDTAVYVADSLGEMGLWFRLADVVVMGGAFSGGIGGHNPLEPARLGKAVVTGPHVFNFAESYADLAAARAVRIVEPGGLRDAIEEALADPSMDARAKACADSQADGFESGWRQIEDFLGP